MVGRSSGPFGGVPDVLMSTGTGTLSHGPEPMRPHPDPAPVHPRPRRGHAPATRGTGPAGGGPPRPRAAHHRPGRRPGRPASPRADGGRREGGGSWRGHAQLARVLHHEAPGAALPGRREGLPRLRPGDGLEHRPAAGRVRTHRRRRPAPHHARGVPGHVRLVEHEGVPRPRRVDPGVEHRPPEGPGPFPRRRLRLQPAPSCTTASCATPPSTSHACCPVSPSCTAACAPPPRRAPT